MYKKKNNAGLHLQLGVCNNRWLDTLRSMDGYSTFQIVHSHFLTGSTPGRGHFVTRGFIPGEAFQKKHKKIKRGGG